MEEHLVEAEQRRKKQANSEENQGCLQQNTKQEAHDINTDISQFRMQEVSGHMFGLFY